MNYTDEQIIKVKGMITKLHEFHLCCRTIFGSHNYDFSEFDFDCLHNVIDEANRLKAENERLNSLCTSKDVIISDLNAEVERLKHILVSFMNEVENWEHKHNIDTSNIPKIAVLGIEKGNILTQIKSEVGKEFAERLKEKAYVNSLCDMVVNVATIDSTLKEMEKQ